MGVTTVTTGLLGRNTLKEERLDKLYDDSLLEFSTGYSN